MCWHTCNIRIWEVEGAKISVYRVSSRSVWPTWDLVLKMQKNVTKAKISSEGKLEKTTDRQWWSKEAITEIYGGHWLQGVRRILPPAHEKSSLVLNGSLGQCPKPASVSESPRTFPEDIKPCVRLPRPMDWNFCTRKGSVAGNRLPICTHITATLCLHLPRLC